MCRKRAGYEFIEKKIKIIAQKDCRY